MKNLSHKNAKSFSMMARIAVAVVALLALQGLVLLYFLGFSGVNNRIASATYELLTDQVISKGSDLQFMLGEASENAAQLSSLLSAEINEALIENGGTPDDKTTGDLLNAMLPHTVDFIKSNSVSGAFVVLDSPAEAANEEKSSRACLYIRNPETESWQEGNSGLLMEYGRFIYSGMISSQQRADLDFSDGYNRDFYFKPIKAALAGSPNKSAEIYGWWSRPFTLNSGSKKIITYTLPIILNNGEICGVFGFEISQPYLQSAMPSSSVPFNMAFYMLGQASDGVMFNDAFIASNSFGERMLDNSKGSAPLSGPVIHESGGATVFTLSNNNISSAKYTGALRGISLYNEKSVFKNENWLLGCFAPDAVIMADFNSVNNAIVFSVLSTVIVTLLLALIVIMYLFEPISKLAESVRSIDPERPVRFELTGIREVDDLSAAFEMLSDGVSKAAVKMFEIIELVNMPIGSFDINYKDETVRLSKSLFNILEIAPPIDGSDIIPVSDWHLYMTKLIIDSVLDSEDGITETLCRTNDGSANKWLRMRIVAEKTREIGIIIDVTDDVTQKQKLEFERNSDHLTKLLNRRAFLARAMDILSVNSDKVCLMMFADLDDLKSVNDLYGHDTGDEYIIAFATFLNRFKELNYDVAVGRMSGDEFVLFLGGFDSREEAKTTFDSVFDGLSDYFLTTSDGTEQKLGTSAGISYYPSDALEIPDLLKYADYAMYEIKHSKKGEVNEFDINSYNKNTFVLNKKSILNLIFEKRRVRFVFQPIVDVTTGEVYAYEALMRPIVREFKSPDDIIKIARSQSKLYQVEKLTFNVMLDWIAENIKKINGKKIFINSMPNQIFTQSDMHEMSEKYSHLFDRVVLDVVENDFSNKEDTKKKMDSFREFGSMVAVEDYGSDHSNPMGLLFIKPDFIKIDKSIVRDICNDIDKQRLVESIVAYSSKRGMKVVAVGVETSEEMGMLIRFGVNFVQGYYLGRPTTELADIPAELKRQIAELSSGQTA